LLRIVFNIQRWDNLLTNCIIITTNILIWILPTIYIHWLRFNSQFTFNFIKYNILIMNKLYYVYTSCTTAISFIRFVQLSPNIDTNYYFEYFIVNLIRSILFILYRMKNRIIWLSNLNFLEIAKTVRLRWRHVF